MSDEETHILQTEEGQMLTAEYKDGLKQIGVQGLTYCSVAFSTDLSGCDFKVRPFTQLNPFLGQLQIVEVTPFDKANETNSQLSNTKYLQVLDSSRGLMQLDLLNLTIVKCTDDDTYQVVGASSDDGDTTLTCVLSSDDIEDGENQDSYVVMNNEEGNEPLVFLQSSLQQINTQQNLRKENNKKSPLTPAEILEKAKALQKAKALLQAQNTTKSSNRGRKRKSDLPPPMELLSSPNFKLYLYSCKMCNFKCNAVKEMSKHKSEEHAGGKNRGVSGRSATLQCAKCPYRGHVHSQLLKHMQDVHLAEEEDSGSDLRLDCDDVSEADVLVCGACGFESGQRNVFKEHIERAHGVSVMIRAVEEGETTDLN